MTTTRTTRRALHRIREIWRDMDHAQRRMIELTAALPGEPAATGATRTGRSAHRH